MPRDYAKYSSKKIQPKRVEKKPKKLWILVLLAALLLIFLFVRLLHNSTVKTHDPEQKIAKIKAIKKDVLPKAKKSNAVKQAVHFDFYTILPKEKVNVATIPGLQNKDKTQYILQAALVKDEDSAKQIESELSLLGLDVYIDQVQKDGDTWFSVNIGPYYSEAAAVKDQQKLEANNIKTELHQNKP